MTNFPLSVPRTVAFWGDTSMLVTDGGTLEEFGDADAENNVRFAEFIETLPNLSEIVAVGDCCAAKEFWRESISNEHSL